MNRAAAELEVREVGVGMRPLRRAWVVGSTLAAGLGRDSGH